MIDFLLLHARVGLLLSVVILLGSFGFCAKDSDPYYHFPDPRFPYQRTSKAMDRANTIEKLLETRGKIEAKIKAAEGIIDPDKKKEIEANRSISQSLLKEIESLSTEQNSIDAKMGRVIAQGLAGGDAWKSVQDENISGVAEGVQIGALVRVSQSVGNVVGKRMENTMDRVLGGTWDFLIGKLLDGWDATVQFFFHAGQEPFTIRELRGWTGLIMNCFEDVERLLKDGLKDSLRGTDSSLRQVGDIVEQEAAQTAWTVLIAGYIRQLDYFVGQIDSRIEYYDEKSIVVFYAREIKNRLIEFQTMLFKNQSLKDLDAYLDSNKAMIPALRKNIDNLFRRLMEQVEPRSYSALGQDTSASGRESRSRRDSDDESPLPRSFGGL